MARATTRERTGQGRGATSALRLITLKDAADLCGISTEMWRRWVAAGQFPRPHTEIRRTWLYRADWVETFIATQEWPEGAKFEFGVGKGRVGDGDETGAD